MSSAINQNMMERYLKDPFGGRQAITARIRGFLHNRGSGYLLITGRPGIGKSALLSHLAFELTAGTPRDPTPVIHYISQRDGLSGEESVLASLNGQLGEVQGFRLPIPDNLLGLRDRFTYLLQNWSEFTPCVIILDGLDQTDGWLPTPALFPVQLPTGVFVIMSARPLPDRSWNDVLALPHEGLQTLQLETLERTEMQDMLKAAGGSAAVIAEDPALLTTVFSASRGEPLYLHCLVDALRTGCMTLGNLTDEPPGVSRELARWWEEIERNDSQATSQRLILFLASTRGPITPIDIGRLGIEGLSPNTLRPVLWSLRRFVEGDETRGYFISSPLFKHYLSTRFQAELEYYERAMVRELCWPHMGGRAEDSPYAWEYLDAHSIDEHYRERMVCRENLWAKRRLFGSHRSFAKELDSALERHDEPLKTYDLMEYISRSWLSASLHTSGQYVDRAALGLLADWGQARRAADFVELMPNPAQRCEGYLTVGDSRRWLRNTGITVPNERRRLDLRLLELAYTEAMKHRPTEERNNMLFSIAPVLARAGNAAAAMTAVESIGPVSDEDYQHLRRRALMHVAEELAFAGDIEGSFAAAQSPELSEHDREQALALAATGFGESGQPVSALEAILRIASHNLHFPYALMADWNTNTESLLEQLREVDAIDDPADRSSRLRQLAVELERRWVERHAASVKWHDVNEARNDRLTALIWLGHYEQVVAIYRHLPSGTNDWDHPQGRDDLILALLADGQAEAAQELAVRFATTSTQAILDRWQGHWQGLRDKIRGARGADVFVSIAETFPEGYYQGQTLAVLAPELVLAGLGEQLETWFLDDDHRDERHIVTAAAFVARAGLHAAAESLATRCLQFSSSGFLQQAFRSLSGALAGDNRINEIVPLARRLVRKKDRCEALADVAGSLAVVDRAAASQIMEAALDDAERLAWYPTDLNPIWAALARQAVHLANWKKARILADRVGIDDCAAWSEVSAHCIKEAMRQDPEQVNAALDERLAFLDRDTAANEFTRGLLPSALGALQKALVAVEGLDDLAMIVAERADGAMGQAICQAQLAARLSGSDPERALAMALEAVALARKAGESTPDDDRRTPYEAISLALLEGGWLQGAIAVMDDDTDPEHRQYLESALALAIGSGKFDSLDRLLVTAPELYNEVAPIAAVHMVEAGQVEQALQTVDRLSERQSDERGDLLLEMARASVGRCSGNEASRILALLPDDWKYADQARFHCVVRAHTLGLWDGLEAIVDQMSDPEWRSLARFYMRPPAPNDDHKWAGARQVSMLATALDAVGSDSDRHWLLSNSALALALAGRLDDLAAQAHRIRSSTTRDELFAGAAYNLARLGRINDAGQLLSKIEDAETKRRTVNSVTEALDGLDTSSIVSGIEMIMRITRQDGREAIADAIAQMIPVLNNLPDFSSDGSETVLQLVERLDEVENWLGQPCGSDESRNVSA